MTNLKELRLNNWVYSLEIGEYVQIASIDSEFVTLKDHVTWDYVYADMIEPIPLTEEILLKSGGNKDMIFDRFKLIWRSEYKYWYVVDVYSKNYFTKIEYVHEWQNFIHVLNGQELKIEL